ncbi:monocyte chemotactic protein 1B-like [Anguilla anguilla]|uniref:monocyte chemotactic protein 1B-like n=1 Tax=Anguilla anguilla TaxID=7936 RepID=UPI0015AF0C17|nr:monocyte chemotactic protein 1B-like [Anguilla anguilla]
MSIGCRLPFWGGMKLFLTAALFCVLVASTCVSATNGPALSCCLTITDTKVHPKNIVDYTIQKIGLCPVEAVVFRTRKKKTVCSDPGKAWVARAMDKVDKLKKERGSDRAARGKAARNKAGRREQRRQTVSA